MQQRKPGGKKPKEMFGWAADGSRIRLSPIPMEPLVDEEFEVRHPSYRRLSYVERPTQASLARSAAARDQQNRLRTKTGKRIVEVPAIIVAPRREPAALRARDLLISAPGGSGSGWVRPSGASIYTPHQVTPPRVPQYLSATPTVAVDLSGREYERSPTIPVDLSVDDSEGILDMDEIWKGFEHYGGRRLRKKRRSRSRLRSHRRQSKAKRK